MVIVSKEAAVVRDIFNMTINGMGTYVIAKALNDRGLQKQEGSQVASVNRQRNFAE